MKNFSLKGGLYVLNIKFYYQSINKIYIYLHLYYEALMIYQ